MLYTWSRYNIVSQLHFNVKKQTNTSGTSGGPVKIPRFHCRGHRLNPGSGKFCMPQTAAKKKQNNNNNNKQLSFIWLKDSGPHSLLAVRQEPL